MSTVRRYTAEDFIAQAEHLENYGHGHTGLLLRQAAETEARVMGLVDHLEKMIFFAELYDLKNSFDEEEIRLAREALSKFRGEDHA